MAFVLVVMILLVVIGIPLLLGRVALILILFLLPAFTTYVTVRAWGYTKGLERERRKSLARRVALSTYLLFGLLLTTCVVLGNNFAGPGQGWELAKKATLIVGIVTIGGSILLTISVNPLWIGYIGGIRFCRWLTQMDDKPAKDTHRKINLPLISPVHSSGTYLQLACGIAGAVMFYCFLVAAPFLTLVAICWASGAPLGDIEEGLVACVFTGAIIAFITVNILYLYNSPEDSWLPICTDEVIEAFGDIVGAAFDLVFGKT